MRQSILSCSSILLLHSIAMFPTGVQLIPVPRASAQTQTLAHYELGQDGLVTYAAAAAKLIDRSENGFDLAVQGDPVFFASAPEHATGGSILFDGDGDGYVMPRAIGGAADDFVLEAWANAREAQADALQGVVALGHGGLGYSIARQGEEWLAFVGGIGPFSMGTLREGRWTHLALVAVDDDCSLYRDGRRVGTFRRAAGLAASFALGCIESGKHEFHGLIHEARLSAVVGENFDPARDLLLDHEGMRKRLEQDRQRQAALIAGLTSAGPGVRVVSQLAPEAAEPDWLVHEVSHPVELQVQRGADPPGARLLLTNGLVSRAFFIGENLACTSLRLLNSGAEFLRAVKPEARIRIDGVWFEIGGLKGQPEMSYLLESWLPDMHCDRGAFRFAGMSTSEPEARYPWKRKFNATVTDWPPKGLHLALRFAAPADALPEHEELGVTVHYEVYEGLPVISKWLTLENGGEAEIIVDAFEGEHLAVAQDQIGRLHLESDYAFALANVDPLGSALMHFQGEPKPYHAGRGTTEWRVDPEYHTWASQNPTEDVFLGFPHRCLVVSRPPMGPGVAVPAGGSFESFRSFELLGDSDDRVRLTLGHRRLYRKLAPQTSESLLAAAITSQDEEQLLGFLDQAADLGFERLDIHPWPGISHDNLDREYTAKWKRVADHARERGIILGGYELSVASRGRGAEHDCIDPVTGQPGSLFGQSMCIATEWADDYFERLMEFVERTGLGSWNADGPYHGDPCASEVHANHRGMLDSQWAQWRKQVEVIHELQARGLYLPLPEWYFLNGQCATGMGYREASANLTPQQQLLLGRQYVYDGTWHKTPTMGWMGLQLVGFYTSDPRVGLEPLSENLDRYERGLVQYLGSGCQLSVRGNRLYDSSETRAMVKGWVDWFREHRAILTSDIIHLGRPTGRDLDCILHVNARLEERGLAVVFNPTDHRIRRELRLPLYYAGLTDAALISEGQGPRREYPLDRACTASVPVDIEADGFTWLLIEAP